MVLHTKDQRGIQINDDDEHKLIYEAQVHEMQIRALKDKRILVTSQRIIFKALTIMACQLVMAYAAIT